MEIAWIAHCDSTTKRRFGVDLAHMCVAVR